MSHQVYVLSECYHRNKVTPPSCSSAAQYAQIANDITISSCLPSVFENCKLPVMAFRFDLKSYNSLIKSSFLGIFITLSSNSLIKFVYYAGQEQKFPLNNKQNSTFYLRRWVYSSRKLNFSLGARGLDANESRCTEMKWNSDFRKSREFTFPDL